MAVVLTTTYTDKSRRKRKLGISAVLSGNYIAGGVTIDFTTVLNPKFFGNGKPGANPSFAEITNTPAGYSGELIQGTTMKNWLLKIWTAPGNELPAAAIPAALAADAFNLEVSGPLGAF